MRTEIRTQRIASTKERLERGTEAKHEIVRCTVLKMRLVTGHEAPQPEDKVLDGGAALGEASLTRLICVARLPASGRALSHDHGLVPAASTTACVSWRYPARRRRETESRDTPAIPA